MRLTRAPVNSRNWAQPGQPPALDEAGRRSGAHWRGSAAAARRQAVSSGVRRGR